MLKFITIALLSILLATGETANAQSAGAMSCTTRLTKSPGSKLFLNCPAEGRAGFVSDVTGTNIGRADVTLTSSDGQIRELKLTPTQTANIFGESDETGITASIATLTDRLSRRTTNGEIALYPGEIKSLGFDPNAIGSTKLSVRSVTITSKAVLLDEKGEISKSPSESKVANSRCLYVGSMKIISPKSSGATCPVGTPLCTAAIECMDERIGWVTRAAVCKSVDKRCPVSADTCVTDQSGADFVAVTVENSAQPKTREAGTKR